MNQHSDALKTFFHLDKILDEMQTQGFSIIDDLYPVEYMQTLQQECSDHLDQFRKASIQDGVMTEIRSDHILWIEPDLTLASQHIAQLEHLSQDLNRYFFAGIRDIEAHFACYHAGEFYALHRDNPQQKNGRVFSTVYYLHSEWQNDWQGQLRLQDIQNQWHIIEPKANRMVLFQSDLLHEVLETKQDRLSITAWMRNSDPVLG
ncbi:SM-20-related protein [Acinetobacter marinus]|uniref:SM-20-related protein n=1 Tax=Acinetobacter marinus TaxID=281375 RepID=A0A1G6GKV5_9GAMM|nr:2OG-Fe(II) oxygenase [Acinetobacter marinus]SDB82375.1 SM-20-related protein [Acinetobacter marinus]